MKKQIIFALALLATPAYAQLGPIGSSVDPYIIVEPNDPTIAPGFQNTAGRTLSNYATIGGTKRCNIVWFGQSNSGANYASPGYSISNPTAIFNFDIYNGGLYATTAPLLGGGGPPNLVTGGSASGGGNSLNAIADNLIAGGTCDRVVLIPASISSTTAADWATGSQRQRIIVTSNRLVAAGIPISAVCWTQGESDTAAGTSQASYTASLTAIISTIQAQSAFSGVPIFISKTSYYLGTTATNVTNPQVAAVNGTTVFSLGNSDSLGAGDRRDNIHFNTIGVTDWAAIAGPALAAHLTVR